MRFKLTAVLFLYSLIYFAHIQTTYSATSRNGSVKLELRQTTPTIVENNDKNITENEKLPKKHDSDSSITFYTFPPIVSFGFLVPGDPVIRSSSVQILTHNLVAFDMYIEQNHSLKSAEGNIIPDTSCDGGSCTNNLASVWKSPLTYGYGFRCENSTSCSKDFQNPDFFRSITNIELNQRPAQILTGSSAKVAAEIVYKLNIPSTQAAEPYTNTITYTIIPRL